MSRIGVLHSESAIRAHAAAARSDGQLYRFRHLGRTHHWLKGGYAGLAVNGARHWLWRLGRVHTLVAEAELRQLAADEMDLLIVPDAGALESPTIERLDRLAAAGCFIWVAGPTNLASSFLGARRREAVRLPGYLLEEASGLPVAGPGHLAERAEPMDGAASRGSLFLHQPGDSPDAAVFGHAWIHRDRVLWSPAPVFEYLGGLIQGQTDWWPLRQRLGERAFGLADRICFHLEAALQANGFGGVLRLRVPVWGGKRDAAVLRHDTDDSDDPTFWQEEQQAGRPATFAVLHDARAAVWAERLRASPHLELALHYRSNREGFLQKVRARLFGALPGADVKAMTQDGLIRQAAAAEPLLGRVETIHRHYNHVVYPELLLALESLFERCPQIIASNSLGRFALSRYGGSERVRIPQPMQGIPFFFPVRPVIATEERHESLRGWEGGALIDPAPAQLDACADWARRFPGGCHVWVYHPAHTHRWVLAPEGTLAWYQAATRLLDESWWVATSAQVHRRLNQYTQLFLRRSRAGAWELHHGGTEAIEDVRVEDGGSALSLSRLDPGQSAALAQPLEAAAR